MKRLERSWKSKNRDAGSRTGSEPLFEKDPGIRCVHPGYSRKLASGRIKNKRRIENEYQEKAR
jgi:hypothetical protein